MFSPRWSRISLLVSLQQTHPRSKTHNRVLPFSFLFSISASSESTGSSAPTCLASNQSNELKLICNTNKIVNLNFCVCKYRMVKPVLTLWQWAPWPPHGYQQWLFLWSSSVSRSWGEAENTDKSILIILLFNLKNLIYVKAYNIDQIVSFSTRPQFV